MPVIIPDLAAWPSTLSEAKDIQKKLQKAAPIQNDFDAIDVIAGIDVSYDIKSNISRAVVVLLKRATLQPFETVIAKMPTTFPYISGFLSFRETPVIIKALSELKGRPDLLMVDGQGVAHPRRLGIAAHIGVLTNMPAIGVAKSRLVGTFEEVGPAKGAHVPLMDKGERIGTVLRSKDKVNPLFISPGHRVDHDTAVDLTMECLTKYRLPEPTRIADKVSKSVEEYEETLFA